MLLDLFSLAPNFLIIQLKIYYFSLSTKDTCNSFLPTCNLKNYALVLMCSYHNVATIQRGPLESVISLK